MKCSRQFAIRGMLLAVAIFGLSHWTMAYNPAGHFHTIRAIVENSFQSPANAAGVPIRNEDERRLVEYCAQLPDLSDELDATKTYELAVLQWNVLNWAKWGWFNSVPDTNTYKRMVAIQQLQHTLTGGNSLAMRDVALYSARYLLWDKTAGLVASDSDRQAKLCAVGFSLHMYGDTFAHRLTPWNNDNQGETLYPTGRGHAFDSHFPDDIHCNSIKKVWTGKTDCVEFPAGKRFNIWADYLDQTGPLLADLQQGALPFREIHPNAVDCRANPPRNAFATDIACAVFGIVAPAGRRPQADADDNNSIVIIEDVLSKAMISPLPTPLFDAVHSGVRSCEQNMTDAANYLNAVRSWPNPPAAKIGKCAIAWEIYSNIAWQTLQYCEQLAKHSPGSKIPSDVSKHLPNCANAAPVDDSWTDLVLRSDAQGLKGFMDPKVVFSK